MSFLLTYYSLQIASHLAYLRSSEVMLHLDILLLDYSRKSSISKYCHHCHSYYDVLASVHALANYYYDA
jgi:hypothetical protein